MSETAIILFSNLATDQLTPIATRRMEDALNAKKIVYEKVDGSDAAQVELRNKLFGVSSLRGKYPQLFIVQENGDYKYVGQWDETEMLIESDEIPAETLDANPHIDTFKKVFANVKRQ
jgi:hypothetical protein